LDPAQSLVSDWAVSATATVEKQASLGASYNLYKQSSTINFAKVVSWLSSRLSIQAKPRLIL